MPARKTRLRRATLALAVALTAVLFVLGRSSGPAGAQQTTTTARADSTTSTTLDPTSETAPILEITPGDSTPPADGADGSESSSSDSQKFVIFAAALLLPLAGIVFLVWFARRKATAANARARARSGTDPEDDESADSSD